jgi:hypothetical protein
MKELGLGGNHMAEAVLAKAHKFRLTCSNHTLRIETGRHEHKLNSVSGKLELLPRCERLCQHCTSNSIEVELHFTISKAKNMCLIFLYLINMCFLFHSIHLEIYFSVPFFSKNKCYW